MYRRRVLRKSDKLVHWLRRRRRTWQSLAREKTGNIRTGVFSCRTAPCASGADRTDDQSLQPGSKVLLLGLLARLRLHGVPALHTTVLAFICIAFVWFQVANRYFEYSNELLVKAREASESTLSLLEENVLRTIAEADHALQYLRDAILRAEASGVVDHDEIVRSAKITSGLVVQFASIDARGTMRASSVGAPPSKPIDLSDREHFRIHLGTTDDTLFIGKPLIGRASGQWSVQLSRPVLGRERTFRGVVVASINPAHLAETYDGVAGNRGKSISVIGADGVVRASGGKGKLELGESIGGTHLLDEMMRRSVRTIQLDRNDDPRIISFRKVRGHELFVTTSVARKGLTIEALRGFWENVIIAALVTMAILVSSEHVRRAQTAMRQKAHLLQLTLENMRQGIVMVSKDLKIPVLNARYAEILDLPRSFVTQPPSFPKLLQFLEQKGEYRNVELPEGASLLDCFGPKNAGGRFDSYVRHRDNGTIVEVHTVYLSDGGFVRTFKDVTRERQAEEHARQLARLDHLTGLANRRVFQAELEARIDRCRAASGTSMANSGFAVAFLDVDRFKTINDLMGHRTGDELLKLVARRLEAEIPADEVASRLVARIGGDEFAIILNHAGNRNAVVTLVERLVVSLGRPYAMVDQTVNSSSSFGIAFFPDDGAHAEALTAAADLALYAAKNAGRSTFRFFDRQMGEAARAREQLESDMRLAIERNEFLLHYQSIHDCLTGAVKSYEALMRWSHPVRGMISPMEFIPVAESSGLIVQLGAWALSEACREAASWPGSSAVTVNVSPMQLTDPGFVGHVEDALRSSGLAPRRLILEITETALVNDVEKATRLLESLKALGIRIAMDDFGTGYSSLSYLELFPFDKIKIDRAFIRRVTEGGSGTAIIQAIVSIARSCGMKTVAEGVETADQHELLKLLGCDEVQGFLFSRPMPIARQPKAASVVAAGAVGRKSEYDLHCRGIAHCDILIIARGRAILGSWRSGLARSYGASRKVTSRCLPEWSAGISIGSSSSKR